MNFLRRHWYNVGLVVAILTAVVLAFAWNEIGILQRLLILNFIVMQLHQFEEYAFPGGLPAVANILEGKKLNQNATMWGCVITVYAFYFLPIFFPNQIGWGLGGIISGLLQIFVHLTVNAKLKHWYAMGNFSVIFGHIPIGIYYVWYVVTNNLVTTSDWITGFAILLFIGIFLVGLLGYKILSGDKYPYEKEELEKPWIMKRIKKLKA
jgi:hypothetical protein